MGLFDSFKKKSKADNQGEDFTEEAEESSASLTGIPCEPGDFLFEIREIFPLKEQGCVLVGEIVNGEVVPGAKAAYLDASGRKVFYCTISAIEQNKVKMKKASALYMGLFGANFSLVIPEFNANAFQKGHYLSIPAEGTVELTELQRTFESVRMTQERKLELLAALAEEDIFVEAEESYSIQDTIFSVAVLRNQTNQQTEEEKKLLLKTKADEMYQLLLKKLRELPHVYLTYDQSTNYPFINNSFVDVYTKREYAELAVLYYKEQFRNLEVRELPVRLPEKPAEGEEGKNVVLPAFALFYYLGMERVFVDNGLCRVVIRREDILPPPDYSKTPGIQEPVVGPALRYHILDFFAEARWKVNYEQRNQVLKAKEDRMLLEISKAKFLIPMKYEGKTEKTGNNQIKFTQNTKLMFAGIKNGNDDMFTPVFTDFTEFGKLYPPKEWNGAVITIADAIRINKGKGIVVNPAGENLVLNEKAIEAVQNIMKNEAEAKKAKELQNKENTAEAEKIAQAEETGHDSSENFSQTEE